MPKTAKKSNQLKFRFHTVEDKKLEALLEDIEKIEDKLELPKEKMSLQKAHLEYVAIKKELKNKKEIARLYIAEKHAPQDSDVNKIRVGYFNVRVRGVNVKKVNLPPDVKVKHTTTSYQIKFTFNREA